MGKHLRVAFDDAIDQITDADSDSSTFIGPDSHVESDDSGTVSIHTDSSDLTINPDDGQSVTVTTDGDDVDVNLTKSIINDLGSDVDSFTACDDHLASRRISRRWYPIDDEYTYDLVDDLGLDPSEIERIFTDNPNGDPIDHKTIVKFTDGTAIRYEEDGSDHEFGSVEDAKNASRRISFVVDSYGDPIKNGDVLFYTDESGRPTGQDARVVQVDDDSVIVEENGDRYTVSQNEIDEYGLILDYPYDDSYFYASRRTSSDGYQPGFDDWEFHIGNYDAYDHPSKSDLSDLDSWMEKEWESLGWENPGIHLIDVKLNEGTGMFSMTVIGPKDAVMSVYQEMADTEENIEYSQISKPHSVTASRRTSSDDDWEPIYLDIDDPDYDDDEQNELYSQYWDAGDYIETNGDLYRETYDDHLYVFDDIDVCAEYVGGAMTGDDEIRQNALENAGVTACRDEENFHDPLFEDQFDQKRENLPHSWEGNDHEQKKGKNLMRRKKTRDLWKEDNL